MTAYEIPIAPVTAQSFSVSLGGQNCKIEIRTNDYGVFLSLWLESVAVSSFVLCRDRVSLVQRQYVGFSGDLFFVDTQGKKDPEYIGFNDRYRLVYVE